MNKITPSLHWIQLVNQTMTARRCTHAQAWRITADAHPAAATLMSAIGHTRQSVQFFNSRVMGKAPQDKREAGKQLAKFANEKTKSGLPYGQAWNAACAEHPKLAMAMEASVEVQFANAGSDPVEGIRQQAAGLSRGGLSFSNAGGAVPVAAPQLKAIFRLPPTCSQEEFAAAWHSNGDTLAPINPGKCFAGLVDYHQTKKSLDYDAAINAAKTAYPALWELVELISKEAI
ncbi:MAG: hypothetical protein WCK57_07120 [Verrucomicrobiae bacterium]